MEKDKKMKKGEKKYSLKGSSLWGVLLFGILLLIDMLTKIVADAYFDPADEPIKLIPGYLELRLSYNRGIAFSMASGWDEKAKMALVLSTCVLFVIFAIVYFKMDKRRSWVRVALVFIIAGGVGNLIDRVYYQMWDPNAAGGVRDMVYLKFYFDFLDFGVCNFADFFIVGGAIALVLAMLFFDTGAVCPLTKKYKQLSKEAEEAEEAKKAAKIKAAKEKALAKKAERKE
ncbi:MAG: signal peptidase II [Clostridia bacterium]|nr:signal peptidase II [Clostridia bacterium]